MGAFLVEQMLIRKFENLKKSVKNVNWAKSEKKQRKYVSFVLAENRIAQGRRL